MRHREYEMRELALGIYDGPHATPPRSETGGIFLGIKNITPDGKLDLSNPFYIAQEDLKKWTRRVTPKPGDIVFSYEATLHRYTIIPDNFYGCLGRRLALIRPNPYVVDTKYLFYIFLSPFWRSFIEANIITGSTVDRIPLVKFPKYKIILPPLPIQRRIANILSAYDDLIEINQQRIRLLEDMARQLYREWFVRLRFPGWKEGKMAKGVPEGWEVIRIDSLYSTSSGGTPSREKREYYENGTHNWIKTGELTDGFLFDTEEKISDLGLKKSSAKIFPPYTTIFAMYGNTIGQLGITTQPSATNQACCAIIPKTRVFDFEFIFLTLLAHRETIISFGMGAAQQNVNQDEIKKFKILKPTNELALKFKDLVNPMFEQIKTLQQQNTHLCQIRDRLLPRLVSGKLAVGKHPDMK